MPSSFFRLFRFALCFLVLGPAAAHAAQWEVHTNANDLAAVSAIGTSVWAGSLDGLHRYDSTVGTFERFFREPGGLLSNAVRAVEADDSGTLWIGTADAGVSLLTTAGRWIAITAFDGLPSNSVTALAPQAGGMWVGTITGLAFFLHDELQGAWPDGVTPSPFANPEVVALSVDATRAWVATKSAVYVTANGGLDWQTVTAGLDVPRVRALAYDGTRLWAATETGAVYVGGETGSWTASANGLSAPARSLGTRGGVLIAGTSNGPVFRWNDVVDAWESIGGPTSAVVDVAADGTLWAGNVGGLWRYTGSGWIRLRSAGPSGNWVHGMTLDRAGSVWITTRYDGASRYDDARGWRPFGAAANTDTALVTENFLFLCMQDREGYLWFGDWGGSLARLDDRGSTPKYTHFFDADTILFTIGWAGAQDPGGPVWIGLDTPSRGSIVAQGIIRIDPDGTRTNLQAINAPGMSGQQVRFLEFASDGTMWTGFADAGVDIFPDSSLALTTRVAHLGAESGLLNSNVWGIDFFGGDAYIAADGGISRYRVTGGAPVFVERYFTPTISANGAVHPLALDAAGGIWLATATGLWHRAPDGTTELFDTENSPLVGNSVHSVVVDRTRGDIWVGTSAGVNRLRPGDSGGSTAAPGTALLVLPNPVRLSSAGMVLAMRSPDGDPLARTDVEVHDLFGRRLNRLRTDGDGILHWNGDTEDGRRLRAGVYLLRALRLDDAGVPRTAYSGRIVLLP